MQIKFSYIAHDIHPTSLDNLQLVLGRYLLPFGRAHQMSQVSKSVPQHPLSHDGSISLVPRLKIDGKQGEGENREEKQR